MERFPHLEKQAVKDNTWERGTGSNKVGSMVDEVQLDGAAGEGGGQILRSSLSLALATGRAFRIRDIRANRSPPGLRPQHLVAVLAAAEIGAAEVEGAIEGSRELSFIPGTTRADDYRFFIRTAGCAPLVLQTVLPPLALLKERSTVVMDGGGTHLESAPSTDYLLAAWLPAIERLGFRCRMVVDRLGFYPRGGGLVRTEVAPRESPAGRFTPATPDKPIPRGRLRHVRIRSGVANLPESIAQRQAKQAVRKLGTGLPRAEVHIERHTAASPGTYVVITLDFDGGEACFVALGKRGKTAETVADEAVRDAKHFLQAKSAAVDPHLADQMLVPTCLARQPITFVTSEITQHLLTNREVVSRFSDAKIAIEGQIGEPGIVRVAWD